MPRAALLLLLFIWPACDRGAVDRLPPAGGVHPAVSPVKATSPLTPCRGRVAAEEGACAPDFTLPDLAGRSVRLSELRGQVVLINFWASWCPPCLEELPALGVLAKHLAGQKFVLLAVNVEDGFSPEHARTFFRGQPLSFSVLGDSKKKVAPLYNAFKLPETYVIDKNGRIVDHISGPRFWDDSLIVHYLQRLIAE